MINAKDLFIYKEGSRAKKALISKIVRFINEKKPRKRVVLGYGFDADELHTHEVAKELRKSGYSSIIAKSPNSYFKNLVSRIVFEYNNWHSLGDEIKGLVSDYMETFNCNAEEKEYIGKLVKEIPDKKDKQIREIFSDYWKKHDEKQEEFMLTLNKKFSNPDYIIDFHSYTVGKPKSKIFENDEYLTSQVFEKEPQNGVCVVMEGPVGLQKKLKKFNTINPDRIGYRGKAVGSGVTAHEKTGSMAKSIVIETFVSKTTEENWIYTTKVSAEILMLLIEYLRRV